MRMKTTGDGRTDGRLGRVKGVASFTGGDGGFSIYTLLLNLYLPHCLQALTVGEQ